MIKYPIKCGCLLGGRRGTSGKPRGQPRSSAFLVPCRAAARHDQRQGRMRQLLPGALRRHRAGRTRQHLQAGCGWGCPAPGFAWTQDRSGGRCGQHSHLEERAEPHLGVPLAGRLRRTRSGAEAAALQEGAGRTEWGQAPRGCGHRLHGDRLRPGHRHSRMRPDHAKC